MIWKRSGHLGSAAKNLHRGLPNRSLTVAGWHKGKRPPARYATPAWQPSDCAERQGKAGGEGNRTPVLMAVSASIYMFSVAFNLSGRLPACGLPAAERS